MRLAIAIVLVVLASPALMQQSQDQQAPVCGRQCEDEPKKPTPEKSDGRRQQILPPSADFDASFNAGFKHNHDDNSH
jgi:hypothetical protein